MVGLERVEEGYSLSPRGMSSLELLEVDPEEPTLFTVLLPLEMSPWG